MANAADVLRAKVLAYVGTDHGARTKFAKDMGRERTWATEYLNGSFELPLIDLDRVAELLDTNVPSLFVPTNETLQVLPSRAAKERAAIESRDDLARRLTTIHQAATSIARLSRPRASSKRGPIATPGEPARHGDTKSGIDPPSQLDGGGKTDGGFPASKANAPGDLKQAAGPYTRAAGELAIAQLKNKAPREQANQAGPRRPKGKRSR